MADAPQRILSTLLPQSLDTRTFARRWFVVAALLILIAAYFSYDFYQGDEYFQTIEFASHKLGKTPASDLMWEYPAHIRPWLQPAVYYAIARLSEDVGVRDPFIQAFFFRLVSGICALAAIILLVHAAGRIFERDSERKVTAMLFAILCYIPYLSVRTSSESLSGSFASIGTALIILGAQQEREGLAVFSKRLLLLAGVAFGLAFEFRFQVGFMVLGAILWLLYRSRRPATGAALNALALLFGFALAVCAGTLVDRWGYGFWTFVPWNYLKVNILQGKVSTFGVSPVWGYIPILLKRTGGLGDLVLLLMVVFWIRKPRSLITWVTVPFILVHFLIGHKEDRFLFPMIYFTPLFFVAALSPLARRGIKARATGSFRGLTTALVVLGFAANLSALVIITPSVSQPELRVQRYLYRNFPKGGTVYVLPAADPYSVYGQKMHFFRPENLNIVTVDGPTQLSQLLDAASGKPITLVTHDRNTPEVIPSDARVLRVYSSASPFWDRIDRYIRPTVHGRYFEVYSVE